MLPHIKIDSPKAAVNRYYIGLDNELISDGFGISAAGIEHIVEQLQQTIPNPTITNGHVLALLLHELVDKAALENITCDVSPSTGEGDDEQLMRLKIDQKARIYYKGSSWDLLESQAFCLKMVEIGYMNYLKKPSSGSRGEFLQQIVNAVRPASNLQQWGIKRPYRVIGEDAQNERRLTIIIGEPEVVGQALPWPRCGVPELLVRGGQSDSPAQ